MSELGAKIQPSSTALLQFQPIDLNKGFMVIFFFAPSDKQNWGGVKKKLNQHQYRNDFKTLGTDILDRVDLQHGKRRLGIFQFEISLRY